MLKLVVSDKPNVSFICTKKNGLHINKSSINSSMLSLRKKLNIDFHTHLLRHTHSTTLIQNGANIKDVQLRLGHSQINTTLNIYTHKDNRTSINTVKIFDCVINDDK